jgi:hypothetical protein
MDSGYVRGAIHYSGAAGEGAPNRPPIPIADPDHQRRDVTVQALGEHKDVHVSRILFNSTRARNSANLRIPIRAAKIDWPVYVGVPPLTNQKKAIPPSRGLFNRETKILHEQHVTIRVAEIIVPRYLLRAAKQKIHIGQLASEAFDVRLVADAELLRGLGRALFVAEQNDLDVWMQERPTFQRVALNDAVVARKRFRRGKKSEHALAILAVGALSRPHPSLLHHTLDQRI